MGVRALEDKRFRRAQLRPASRRRRARMGQLLALLRVVLALVAVGGVSLVVARWATTTPALSIERFVVSGNGRLSTGEVTVLLDGMRGQHILLADLAEWRQRLLESPWVADATLRRVLPHTIAVAIVEREPMAIGRLEGRLYLVDERGEAIDDYGPQYSGLDLPVVDGLGRGADALRAALAARLLAALASAPDLMARLSQVNVTNPRDAVVILDGDEARLHVGDEAFVERLRSYLELAPTLRQRVSAIDYVDLRFDNRVFVRPAGGANLAGAGSAERGGGGGGLN